MVEHKHLSLLFRQPASQSTLEQICCFMSKNYVYYCAPNYNSIVLFSLRLRSLQRCVCGCNFRIYIFARLSTETLITSNTLAYLIKHSYSRHPQNVLYAGVKKCQFIFFAASSCVLFSSLRQNTISAQFAIEKIIFFSHSKYSIGTFVSRRLPQYIQRKICGSNQNVLLATNFFLHVWMESDLEHFQPELRLSFPFCRWIASDMKN